MKTRVLSILLLSVISLGGGRWALAYSLDKSFQRIATDLADTCVLKLSDNEYYASGTTAGTRSFDIFKSTDLHSFSRVANYDPGAADSTKTYCYAWAPDLSRDGEQFVLTFSALAVDRGGACPPAEWSWHEVNRHLTTYIARGPSMAQLGAPQLLTFNVGGVPHRSGAGFGEPVIKIDSAIGAGRFYYVWFEGGNNISSVNMAAPPNDLIRHTRAADWGEEVNEGPEVFKRGDKHYFIYSRHSWQGSYTQSYLMGARVADLVRRSKDSLDYVEPIQRAGCARDDTGCIFENAGHGDVTDRYGQYYFLYHKSFPIEGNVRRDAYVAPIHFKPDGKIVSISKTTLSWPSQGSGFVYSLDVKKKGSSAWIGPCISADIIGNKTSVAFNGLCPSAGEQVVHKGQIEQFRLYYSNNGTWPSHQRRAVANDVAKDQLFIDVAANRPVALVDEVVNARLSEQPAEGDSIRLQGRGEADGDYEIVAHRWVMGEDCFSDNRVVIHWHQNDGAKSVFWKDDFPQGLNTVSYATWSRHRTNASDVRTSECMTHRFIVGPPSCNKSRLDLCKGPLDCGLAAGHWCDGSCQEALCDPCGGQACDAGADARPSQDSEVRDGAPVEAAPSADGGPPRPDATPPTVDASPRPDANTITDPDSEQERDERAASGGCHLSTSGSPAAWFSFLLLALLALTPWRCG